jgi:hypothetical protein
MECNVKLARLVLLLFDWVYSIDRYRYAPQQICTRLSIPKTPASCYARLQVCWCQFNILADQGSLGILLVIDVNDHPSPPVYDD